MRDPVVEALVKVATRHAGMYYERDPQMVLESFGRAILAASASEHTPEAAEGAREHTEVNATLMRLKAINRGPTLTTRALLMQAKSLEAEIATRISQPDPQPSSDDVSGWVAEANGILPTDSTPEGREPDGEGSSGGFGTMTPEMWERGKKQMDRREAEIRREERAGIRERFGRHVFGWSPGQHESESFRTGFCAAMDSFGSWLDSITEEAPDAD